MVHSVSVRWFCWLLLWGICTVEGGDWPQILGPHRNGTAEGEKLAEKWPAAGPKVVWERPVGSGFAGIAVAEGKAVVFHREGNDELIEAHQAATGERLWKVSTKTTYVPSISEDDGPLCVPTIAEGIVVCFGAAGRLTAVELASGKELWSRTLSQEYGAPSGYFGAGSSPVVYGWKVFVNLGADRKSAGLIAVDLKTGKTIWNKTKEQASYASPIVTEIEGEPTLIFITRLNVLGVVPEDGRVLWEFPFGKRGPTVNAAAPVIDGKRLYVTASYGIGGVYAELSKDGAKEIWADEMPFAAQYSTPVPAGGAWYGIDGRKDIGRGTLRCVSLEERKEYWSEPEFGVGHLIAADGKLVILKDEGELLLVRADSKKFSPVSEFQIDDGTTRAIPALSNGLLYVRGSKKLGCYDLR